jgi:hypothetical protein
MANYLYDTARERFLKPGLRTTVANGQAASDSINWSEDNIKMMLIDTTNHPEDATDEFLSDVAASGIIKTSGNLGSKTTTDGVALAANVVLDSVTGVNCEAIIIYKDTGGADTTCPLIAWIDDATGLPILPNGADIDVIWDTGANGIFKL